MYYASKPLADLDGKYLFKAINSFKENNAPEVTKSVLHEFINVYIAKLVG